MSTNNRNQEGGYVALMTVIIITAILSVLVFTVGATTFLSRFSVLEREYKRTSVSYAEGCVDAAMLKMAQGSAISVGSCVNYDTDPPTYVCSSAKKLCKICTAIPANPTYPVTVNVRGYDSGAYTNLTVTIDHSVGTWSYTNWTENASNPVPTCTLP